MGTGEIWEKKTGARGGKNRHDNSCEWVNPEPLVYCTNFQDKETNSNRLAPDDPTILFLP